MDYDAYVAARRGRLVERAETQGLAADEADALVDRVLAASAGRIARADDPHPEVLDALERALRGDADVSDDAGAGRRRRTAWTLAAVAVVVVVAAVAVGREPPGREVPSLFGLDIAGASEVLEARGLTARERPIAACELAGRVVGSEPAEGEAAGEGETVEVQISDPGEATCVGTYPDRLRAWELIDFATGRRPAPEFAPSVLSVDARGRQVRLDVAVAGNLASWGAGSPLDALASAAAGDDPELSVRRGLPPVLPCGAETPPVETVREPLTITLTTRETREATDPEVCPTTVYVYEVPYRDLYGEQRGIDVVALAPGVNPTSP